MESLDQFCREKLASLDEKHLRRALHPTTRSGAARVERSGRELVSFSCNDYLGLAHHPGVIRAAQEATARYGAGAGASRLITGDHPLLHALEQRLARLKGTEAALTFGSGYLTNLGVVPALVGPGDIILADELCHACLWAGARMAKARLVRFGHSDVDALAFALDDLRGSAKRALVLTEGVFSMDGDVAPLAALAELCAQHDAWLLVDDAHGFGVLGDGRGTVAEAGHPRVPLQVGTLSKALGTYGGYLASSAAVVELLKSRARTLVYSTGLPPSAAGAALAALEILEGEPERTRAPLALARRFAARAGLPAPQSPVVPVVVGTAEAALSAQALLEREGYLVVAIRPPTVPEGTSRLRFAFTAAHDAVDVDRVADLVRDRVLAGLAVSDRASMS